MTSNTHRIEPLHQAMLFTIATDNIVGLNQLLEIDGLKERAHANQNEALSTAVNHASLDAIKILLGLPNVRDNARVLNKSTRDNLKALLQSEHSPDYAQDALSVQHTVLRFHGTKSNPTDERKNTISNNTSRIRI